MTHNIKMTYDELSRVIDCLSFSYNNQSSDYKKFVDRLKKTQTKAYEKKAEEKKAEEKKAVEILENKAKDFIENSVNKKPTEIDIKLDAYFAPLIQKEKNKTLYDKVVKFYEYRTEIENYENEIEKLEHTFEHKKNIIMREEIAPEATKLIENEWKENIKKGKAPPKKQRQQTIFNNHQKAFQPRFDAIEKEIGLIHQRFLLFQVNKLDDDLNLDWKIRGILLEHKLEDIDKDNTEQDIENKIKEKEKKDDEKNLTFANKFLDDMLKDYKGSNLTLEKLAGTERIGLMSNIECNGVNIRELARTRLQQQQQQ